MKPDIKVYESYPSAAREVREKVFIDEQGFSYDYDETDDIAVHFVMFRDSAAVAACRVFKGEAESTYILGRLAVKKEFRGMGYGSMMLDAAAEYVKSIGGKSLILHSQLRATNFYSSNGFQEYGEIEYEEDCPHIWMKKEVTAAK